MLVIGIFVALVLILDAIGVGICSIVERYSASASLLVLLGLFVVNFVIGWKLAVYLTERFLVSDTQRHANEEHVRWVDTKFAAARK